METTKELENCLEKIIDFSKAILLDKEGITTESISLTMAEMIQKYAGQALELILKE